MYTEEELEAYEQSQTRWIEDWQHDRIEMLLETSNYDEKMRNHFVFLSVNATFDTANDIIAELEENQVDAIDAGKNYGQREIVDKINKIMK